MKLEPLTGWTAVTDAPWHQYCALPIARNPGFITYTIVR